MSTFETIERRRTFKVLAPEPWEPRLDEDEWRELVERLLSAAGCAPFHYEADDRHRQGDLRGAVPRRYHVLDPATCREVGHYFRSGGGGGSLLGMLWAAEVTLLATWLPDPPPEGGDRSLPFHADERNQDHIAGAAAAAQNLLLAATRLGYESAWSSGGPLSSPDYFERLGIPARERLLGALFVFASDTRDAEVGRGGLRSERGTPADWAREATFRSGDSG